MSFRSLLEVALDSRGFELDAGQAGAVAAMQRLDEDWTAYKHARRNAFLKLVSFPDIPRGVYVWGSVGRGKTFLMDSFYAAVPVIRKTRIHFHEFMRGVHRELEEVRGTPDPLDEVARRVAHRYRLICFDEFHVADIADAMILHRLLSRLVALDVGFVMTSNYPPSGLYPGGLHRDRILPAIELLERNLEVVELERGPDYRRQVMAGIDGYLTPSGDEAERRLDQAFDRLAETEDEEQALQIEARTIRAKRRAGGVVWFDFAVLCGGPRSQNDYLELAARFHTIVLSNVPRMTAAQSSEARRFTWLVDVLYDHRNKLLLSAEAPAAELYTEGVLANEFLRTVSRLSEMQSREYLDAPRRAVAERI
ncbi:MAG TPA: cell division protein ZapE [Burkholderiaceae bacterium]|nr:cell division protein ZapE [Burkholderiaceae bacterium]